MEYLDAYDENKNYLGAKSRDEVHEKGYWHNTVHCWLYDKEGNIYFQIRTDANKYYTTASGHVLAGETIPEAFGREIKEEIGIDVDYKDALLLDIVTWKMEKIKNNKPFIDHAWANVNLLDFEDKNYEFRFDPNEVSGLAKMKARDVLDLFNNKIASVDTIIIDKDNNRISKKSTKEDFLLMPGETLIEKYGKILNKVRELEE